MGMSPEGIIYYGYYFTEQDEVGVPDIDHMAEERAKANGAVSVSWSTIPHQFGPERDAWLEETREARTAWYEAVLEEKKIIGVEWAFAGSYDYATDFVCIPESQFRAEWSEMTELKPGDLATEWVWQTILDAHLEEMGIEKPQEAPSWYLTSLYG
jgi:hypothetical protein